MELFVQLQFFTALDYGAIAALLLVWQALGVWIERTGGANPSVSVLMDGYRRQWMDNHVTRDPRVFDALLLASLRQGTAFFASTCLIAIGGALALVGNTDPLLGLARDLALADTPRQIVELKLIILVLLLTNAFLKFVWSHRLFGYASVLLGAVPNDSEHPDAYPRARQSAEVSIAASRNFNRGLRALYFTLAALAWLLGPVPMLLAVLLTGFIVWRREFGSQSRTALMATPD